MSQDPSDKTRLRQNLLAQRQAIALAVRAEWNGAIGKQLSQLLEALRPQIIGGFWPIRDEPDLREFYAKWAALGLQLALPMVIDRNSPLKFSRWEADQPLSKDAMGVWAPSCAAEEVQPDIVLAPCVGFNHANVRLGYGGGFYDRTLAKLPRPQTIGIAYNFMLVDFATEAHDVALDMIITETRLINQYD